MQGLPRRIGAVCGEVLLTPPGDRHMAHCATPDFVSNGLTPSVVGLALWHAGYRFPRFSTIPYGIMRTAVTAGNLEPRKRIHASGDIGTTPAAHAPFLTPNLVVRGGEIDEDVHVRAFFLHD